MPTLRSRRCSSWSPTARSRTTTRRQDFDWERTTALPPNLAGVYRREPHYLDLRWARGATGLDLRNQRFREDVADLAAKLHGKPKHELLGEDRRRQRTVRRRLVLTASVILLLLVALAVLALRESQQRRLALSGQLSADARKEIRRQP